MADNGWRVDSHINQFYFFFLRVQRKKPFFYGIPLLLFLSVLGFSFVVVLYQKFNFRPHKFTIDLSTTYISTSSKVDSDKSNPCLPVQFLLLTFVHFETTFTIMNYEFIITSNKFQHQVNKMINTQCIGNQMNSNIL